MPYIIGSIISVHVGTGEAERVIESEGFYIATKLIFQKRDGGARSLDNHSETGRYVIVFKGKDDQQKTQAITEAINHLLVFSDEVQLIPFPFEIIPISGEELSKERISVEDVVAGVYPFGGSEDDRAFLTAGLISAIKYPCEVINQAFQNVPVVLMCEPVSQALSFYKQFKSEGYRDWHDAIVAVHDPEKAPGNREEQARMESALFHAYKSIEALVGEPGKPERFMRVMERWGLDPNFIIPNREEGKTVVKQIYELQKIRDKKAGHGHKSRSSKPVTCYEILKAQRLAKHVISRAIESVRQQ